MQLQRPACEPVAERSEHALAERQLLLAERGAELPVVRGPVTEERRSRAGSVTASPIRYAAPARQRTASTMKMNTGGYPLKETSFFRIRDPNAIIPRPMMISMWPVDVL